LTPNFEEEAMRPELALPLFNHVLKDFVGNGTLDYERTIRTGELLSLQDHETALVNHDGTTFVISHQCQELKLKLIAHELSHTIDLLDRRELAATITTLDRVRIVFQCLTAELEILETLSPRSYQTIRETLGHGSGQESPGFNQLLNAGPLLWSRLEAILQAAGATLEGVYDHPEQHPDLFALCESFTTLDANYQKWLYHHFMLVKRIIGVARDVPSLAQNATTQLAASMMRPMFDPLWRMRCAMTREWVETRPATPGHGV